MNPDEVDRRISRGRWIKIALFGGIPVLLVAGLFFWYIGRQGRAQAQVDQALGDLQAAGVPVDFKTLTEFYESLTDKGHTAQWLRIFDQLESSRFADSQKNIPIVSANTGVPLPGQPWPEQQAVEAFLSSHRTLLDDLHDAATEPGAVWFPRAFDDFALTELLRRTQATRQAARLLQLEHCTALYAGDGDRAAQSLRSHFGLAATLRGEPDLISQMVGSAVYGVAVDMLKRALEHDALGQEALVELLNRMNIFDDFQAPYRATVAGERAMALPILQEPQVFADVLPFYAIGARPHDILLILDFYERVGVAADEDDLDGFVQVIDRTITELEAEFAAAGPLRRFDTAVTREFSGVTDDSLMTWKGFARMLARDVMRNRQAKLAVGLRLYWHRIGEWPRRLEDLLAVGLDPAPLVPPGGNAFGYRVENDVAVLWSYDHTDYWSNPSAVKVSDDPPPGSQPWAWRLRSPQ